MKSLSQSNVALEIEGHGISENNYQRERES